MKRIIALTATVAVLAFLYFRVDRAALAHNLASTHWGLFAAAVLMFVPQIFVIAVRWRFLVKPFTNLEQAEAVKMVLASQTLNLALPSKVGDLMKGVFLFARGALDLPRSMNLVVFEKMLDVGTLALVMLVGVGMIWGTGAVPGEQRTAVAAAAGVGAAALFAVLALYFLPAGWWSSIGTPAGGRVRRMIASGHEVISLLQTRGAQRGFILILSVAIWLLHMIQIYLFFMSLHLAPPFLQFCSMVPLAIFVGLIPLTIAGFGTRDAALIMFFPQYPESVMLATALYINLRYIVPSLAGAPFLGRYAAFTRPQPPAG